MALQSSQADTGLKNSAAAMYAPHVWRVCISDAVVPPYLTADALHPGIIARVLTRAGKLTGLDTILLPYPASRCRAQVRNGSMDALVAAPTSTNLADFRFPMKDGEVDNSRRIARVNFVWVKRAESPYEWASGQMINGTPSSMLVGIRSGLKVASEPLQRQGFKVDDLATTTRQLLHKLQRHRVDIALAIQEEVEFNMQDPVLQELIVLPNAMSRADYYVAVRQDLPPDMAEQVEAWWATIGKLRDTPEYQAR